MSHQQSRRSFLTAAALTAACLPNRIIAQDSPAPAPPFRNPHIYRFQIGSIEAFSISDGHALIRPAMGMMHPESDRPQMEQIMKDNFERLDGIPLLYQYPRASSWQRSRDI